MTQNIYDVEEFFAGYSQLSRSLQDLSGAAEWPALRALLPDLRGLRVVDLGCGFGWFCRRAREQGAARVLGLDVSEKMLAQAKATTSDAGITYTRSDLEFLGFTICHVEEWSPTDDQIEVKPELAGERERPMFLLVAARP